MLRVVLDTNVLISGLLWDGQPAAVYDAIVAHHTLLISSPLLREFENTLKRRKFADRLGRRGTSVAALVEDVRAAGEYVEPALVPATIRIRDETDRNLLGMAIAGNADTLVTGDRDLLEAHLDLATRIATPAAFLRTEHA